MSHLTNGLEEWQTFESLRVEQVAERGKVVILVLSASDPAAARRSLDKYQRKWNESLRKWFGCDVEVEFSDQSANSNEPNSQ